ncbi:hypothetical protein [Candidatus Uabimicrobium amorphum]|uniref:Uncharacterized protein n=1 Tax=Uabimicrobium amorphum TaxID=2596890 RepID=A0A5S9F1D4_UABAM|nr:hypothetical protein [Candidatus Uabimicrobium amorphum]BBM81963.1 hypothetical protein UABAM_00306 [Candidatus Uabimicrobium amorphum]
MFRMLSIFLILVITASAQQQVTIRDFQFKEQIAGETAIVPQTLGNYVTVVYLWSGSERGSGTSVSTVAGNGRFRQQKTFAAVALEGFKYLNKDYNKLKSVGLKMVGGHVQFQGAQISDIQAFQAIPKEVKFPVFFQCRATKRFPMTPPRAFVFDVGGNLLYTGDSLQEAIKKAQELLVNRRAKLAAQFSTKFFKREVKDIIRGKSLGKTYQKIQKAIAKSSEKEKEGRQILQRLEQMYQVEVANVEANAKYNPVAYVKQAGKLCKNWKGYEKADKFAKEISTMKKSKSFRTKLKGFSVYTKAKQIYYSMEVRGKTSFKSQKFQSDNRRAIAGLKSYCKALTSKYGSTFFAVWARETMKKF